MRKDTLALLCAAALLAACQDKDTYDAGYTARLKASLPDFNLHRTLAAAIDYGPSAAGARVDAYTRDPLARVVGAGGQRLRDSLRGKPALSVFLDREGRFEGNFRLPSGEESLWLVSSAWGAPYCLRADVTGDGVTARPAAAPREARARKRRVLPDSQLTSTTYASDAATFGTLTDIMGGWNEYGRPADSNQLMSEGDYTDDGMVTPLQYTFWHAYTDKQSAYNNGALDNGSMVAATADVNTTIARYYTGDDGQPRQVESCELWLTFLTERAGYASTIGYYYYPNEEAATVGPRDVEKFIVLPNASVSGDGPSEDGVTHTEATAPAERNTKIQLLFRDPATGLLTSKFPPGYTVGYFMIQDAYRRTSPGAGAYEEYRRDLVDGRSGQYALSTETIVASWGRVTQRYYTDERGEKVVVDVFYDKRKRESATYDETRYYFYYRSFYRRVASTGGGRNIDTGKQWVYSNAEWNDPSRFANGRAEQFVALTNEANGDVVYGTEDGGDQSYEDVLFTVTASPNHAIYNPHRPRISQEGRWEVTTAQNTRHGYYAFEDVWSGGGDYDLNDAIVEYECADSVTQVTSYTTHIDPRTGQETGTDCEERSFLEKLTLTLRPRHAGATYRDGFSIQLPEYITALRDQGRVTSIRLDGGPDLKDDASLYRSLNASSTAMDGQPLALDGLAPRLTLELFGDMSQQEEGSHRTLEIQFDTARAACLTPQEWAALSNPPGATDDDRRLRWDYNPFLTVYDLSPRPDPADLSPNSKLEIHLPLYPCTAAGVPTAGGGSSGTPTRDWNLWFVAAVGAGHSGSLDDGSTHFFPFAADIPYSPEFYPSREMTRVDTAYPDFPTYNRQGERQDAADWYNRRARDKTQPFTLSRPKWVYGDSPARNDYDR